MNWTHQFIHKKSNWTGWKKQRINGRVWDLEIEISGGDEIIRGAIETGFGKFEVEWYWIWEIRGWSIIIIRAIMSGSRFWFIKIF